MSQKQIIAITIFSVIATSFFLITGCSEQKKATTVKSSNLIINPSFEDAEIFNSGLYKKGKYSIVKPVGWTTKGQILNDSTGWASDEAHSGKHSLKIENIGGTNAYWEGTPIILKEPSNAFKVSVWTKAKGIKDKTSKGQFQIVFILYLKNSNNQKIKKRVAVNISQENHNWMETKKEILFEGTFLQVDLFIHFSNNIGTVFIDDLFFTAY